jgi:hypothetical protein
MLLLLTLLMAPIYLVCVTAMPVPITRAAHLQPCNIQDAVALCETPFEVMPIPYPELLWPKSKPKPKSKHTSRGSKKQKVPTPKAQIGSVFDLVPVGGVQCAVM